MFISYINNGKLSGPLYDVAPNSTQLPDAQKKQGLAPQSESALSMSLVGQLASKTAPATQGEVVPKNIDIILAAAQSYANQIDAKPATIPLAKEPVKKSVPTQPVSISKEVSKISNKISQAAQTLPVRNVVIVADAQIAPKAPLKAADHQPKTVSKPSVSKPIVPIIKATHKKEIIKPVQQTSATTPAIKDTTFENSGLVNVDSLPITVFLDLKYATENNFTGKQLYPTSKCYLKKQAANGLIKAVQYALEEEEPFFFCIYDCYRPLEAQQDMWDAMPVSGLVASPSSGSNHSRGMAIDIGPCDSDGKPLEMPTAFDEFSAKAAADATVGISDTAKTNRNNLQSVMHRAGFTPIRKEWWHFDYRGYKNQPLLNIVK